MGSIPFGRWAKESGRRKFSKKFFSIRELPEISWATRAVK